MPLLPGIFAASGSAQSIVSGGTTFSDSSYYYTVFFGGTNTFTVSAAPLNVDLVVVAGGGGAGTAAGGGGGAGGVVIRSGMLTTGTYTAAVGAGGAGATGDGGSGANGGNTTFDTITAYGGGGGYHNGTAYSGGSGGGAGYGAGNGGGSSTQTSNGGGTGYGYAGGGNNRSGSGAPYPCGGGGGAGGAGSPATSAAGGAGGIGITSALIDAIGAATGIGQLSGGHYYLAGGGGGSCDLLRANGGLGGGGYGGTVGVSGASANTATDGLDNYGAGGGGGDIDSGGYPPVRAGRGGDGVVVLRYAKGDAVAPTNSYATYGLLFNFDASNASSYPGSGSTWSDISGNGRTISLNNATYSSANGGSIVFNGSSTYGTGTIATLGGTYTIELAFRYTSWNPDGGDLLALTSTNHGLLLESNYSGSTSSGTNTLRYLHRMPYGGGATDDDLSTTTTLALNTSYVVTVTRIQSQRQRVYINGVLARSDWFPTNAAFDSNLTQLTVGRLTQSVANRYFPGNMYSVRAYNRALSSAEVLANFNAIKTTIGAS